MARQRAGSFPLLELDSESRVPLYRQLTDALREAILSGRLAGGTHLPSTRSLAEDLDVSRSTVVAAFEQLNTEGYLASRVGSGTTVPHGLALREPVEEVERSPSGVARGGAEGLTRPLRPGIPALDEFAGSAFGRILRRVLREIGPEVLGAEAHAGDPELRASIARHLRGSRGIRCTADDILVTSGSQEGLSLAFELIGGPGREVWMENPGYYGAREAAKVAGLEPVPVSVDGEGLMTAEGIARWPHACGAYVTPSHQFPTGCLLSARRRVELLEWVGRENGYVVEDDYDSEFRLDGRALPALHGMDEDDRVIYVGTFSKSLAPAIRLGFVLLPPELRERALRLKIDRSGGQPLWLQRATSVFIEEGHFARHVRRTRALYRKRRDTLSEAVEEVLAPRATLRKPTGTMHAILDLEDGTDPAALSTRLAEAGVVVVPLDEFGVPPDPVPGPSVLLGFGGYGEEQIRAAVGTIAAVL